MKKISITNLIAIFLLIVGYTPFIPFLKSIDLVFQLHSITDNVINSFSVWVIPWIAFLACIITAKSLRKNTGYNRWITYSIFLIFAYISISSNNLTEEQELLKIFNTEEDLFIIGKNYLLSNAIEKSEDQAIIYFSRYLKRSKRKENVTEVDLYLKSIIDDKAHVDIGQDHKTSTFGGFQINYGTLGSSNQVIIETPEQVQFYLGVVYMQGNTLDRDLVVATKFFSKACDGGVATGCSNLGIAYTDGIGVKQDLIKAADNYLKACDGRNVIGCNNLGVAYLKGNGVEQNVVRAAKFFSKACDGEYGGGCTNLGFAYKGGRGVKPDYARANELFVKACNLGEQVGCDQYKEQSILNIK